MELGKNSFSQTVAEMETEFKAKMEAVDQDMRAMVKDLNLREQAYKAGWNNIQGLIEGTASQKRELVAKYTEMGQAAIAAYKRAVDQHSPSKAFYQAGKFDMQGLIGGAESEKGELDAAYAGLAQSALSGMERCLSSIRLVERPLPPDRQTSAIVSALSRIESGNSGGAGGTGPAAADIASAVRDALNGASVSLDGRRVGQLITSRQGSDNKAWSR